MNEIQPPRRKTSPLSTIRATLEVVTPIYGGSFEPRTIDEIDIIRPATVRGHLRFWWRALYGHAFADSRELYARESEIWGAAGGEGRDGRSQVELRIAVDRSAHPNIDDKEVNLRSVEGYALFPSRSEKKQGVVVVETAKRRLPPLQFDISLRTRAEHLSEVRGALIAWVLFGGYGGRTRRGLGSLTLRKSHDIRLPSDPSRAAVASCLGIDGFACAGPTSVMPSLLGACLETRAKHATAPPAWVQALGWLREFRQGTSGPSLHRAREPGRDDRPSISNWPEADKVRHMSDPGKLAWAHPPRHGNDPAWPRAGFGLPIIGQFQQLSREPKANSTGRRPEHKRWNECVPPTCEPKGFKIVWYEGDVKHERLASPLIVKALPVEGGFAPMALWLNRQNPANATVGLEGSRSDRRAKFDVLLGRGDEAKFLALAGKATLRDAFFDWLDYTYPSGAPAVSAPKPDKDHAGPKRPYRRNRR